MHDHNCILLASNRNRLENCFGERLSIGLNRSQRKIRIYSFADCLSNLVTTYGKAITGYRVSQKNAQHVTMFSNRNVLQVVVLNIR